MRIPAAAAWAALAASACATMRGGGQAPCEAVTSTLAASATPAPLDGRFILTMVATSGPRSGQSIAGYMTLRPAPGSAAAPAPSVRTALVGVTDIGLEVVGALRLGDTGSEDPRAPGVAVYEQRAAAGAPTITARIGSQATAVSAPGMQEIEADYTALFVRYISADGFGGGWASAPGGAAARGREARGHFCAVRVRD